MIRSTSRNDFSTTASQPPQFSDHLLASQYHQNYLHQYSRESSSHRRSATSSIDSHIHHNQLSLLNRSRRYDRHQYDLQQQHPCQQHHRYFSIPVGIDSRSHNNQLHQYNVNAKDFSISDANRYHHATTTTNAATSPGIRRLPSSRPAKDVYVSQRYEFTTDNHGSRNKYYLEVALVEDQTATDPSVVLRVVTNYDIDNVTWNERRLLRPTFSGSGVWGASTNSLKGEISGLHTCGGNRYDHQFRSTHVYLHWGMGNDSIHDWELPRRPLRDRFVSPHHQVSEDGSAVRSVFRCSSFDPSTSRYSNRNKSLPQFSDLLSASSEDLSSRTSFSRNLSQYVLAQSALTNAECRDLYYQRLAIDDRGSTDMLKQQLLPKSLEVVIPLGPIASSPIGFQFVLHDTKRNLWIRPNPLHAASEQPILHCTSSGVKIFSPSLWNEPSVLNGNFFFPISRALRIFTLLRFRSYVGAMRPPPTIYRQFDLRPAINASIDVGVWPAIEPYSGDRPEGSGGLWNRASGACFVIVELVTNIDRSIYAKGNDDLVLHWGVVYPLPPSLYKPGCFGSTTSRSSGSKIEWEIPGLCSWPRQTKEVFRGRGRQGAVETPLQSGSLYGEEFSMLSRIRLSFPTTQMPSGIAFVLTNSSRTVWVKQHNEDFVVMFSAELKAGISRYRLVIPPSSASLFSAQTLRQPCSANDVNSADSALESSFEDTNAPTATLTQPASRLRRNVFAAGAAVALKMAQSGQLRELSTAASGRRLSASRERGFSPPFRVDIARRGFGSGSRRDNPSDGIRSGDDDNGEAVSRLVQPYVAFAGKKLLQSRSRYRRTYETIIPGAGEVTIQFGSFHNEKGKVALIIACRSPIPLILHWAFANTNNKAGGPWLVPGKQFWPTSTVLAGSCAVETPLRLSSRDRDLWLFELTLPLYAALRTIQPSSTPFWRNGSQQRSRSLSRRQSIHRRRVSITSLDNRTEMDGRTVRGRTTPLSGLQSESTCRAPSSISASSLSSSSSGSLVPTHNRLFPFRSKGRMSKHWQQIAVGWGFLAKGKHRANKLRQNDYRKEDCNGIFFVLTDANHTFWIKEGSNDFHLPLRLADYSLASRFRWSSSERRLLETILTAELTYSTWGLPGRYHLLRILLQDDDYDKSDSNFWSWIVIWFAFSTPAYHSQYRQRSGYVSRVSSSEPSRSPVGERLTRNCCDSRESFLDRSIKTHLSSDRQQLEAPFPFQKGGTFEPSALAEQADQLSLMLTSYWRNYSEQRIYIRLILGRLILPAAAANIAAKVELLLTRWNLSLQPFFKSWIEKVRSSCGREDLVICRAVLALFRTGQRQDFWDVLNFHSINLAKLSSQHAIVGYPIYPFLSSDDAMIITAPTLMEVNAETGIVLRPCQGKDKQQQGEGPALVERLSPGKPGPRAKFPPDPLHQLSGEGTPGNDIETTVGRSSVSVNDPLASRNDSLQTHTNSQPNNTAGKPTVHLKFHNSKNIDKIDPVCNNSSNSKIHSSAESQTPSEQSGGCSAIHLSHSAWVAAANAASSEGYSFSTDAVDGVKDSSRNQKRKLPLSTAAESRMTSTVDNRSMLQRPQQILTVGETGSPQMDLAFSNESLLAEYQNPTTVASDEPSYCCLHTVHSSVYASDQFVSDTDQTRMNSHHTPKLNNKQFNTSNSVQGIRSGPPVSQSTLPLYNQFTPVDHNSNDTNNVFVPSSTTTETDETTTTNQSFQNEPTIWIVQFYPLVQKSAMLRDLSNCEDLLEALFETPSLNVAAYAARRSLRSDVRQALSEILSTTHQLTDVQFFNVSNARHLLFPIIQHATDNQTLRDCMLLDIALQHFQSDLALAFLSSVSHLSPNYCQQKSDATDIPFMQDVSGCTTTISNARNTDLSRSPPPSRESLDPFYFPQTFYAPRSPLHQDYLRDTCSSDTNVDSVAETSPVASLKQSSIPRPLFDFPKPVSQGANLLINPVYLCKEMLACLVTSLLATQVRFNEVDEIHSDMCELLVQPTPPSKWGYGFPVYESIAKLREKTFLNASVEHTQFVRGFYQTQAQKKTNKKSRHLPSPPRPVKSPFVIFPAVKLPIQSLLTSPDLSVLDPPTDCSSDVDSCPFVPPSGRPHSHSTRAVSRPRLVSDASSSMTSLKNHLASVSVQPNTTPASAFFPIFTNPPCDMTSPSPLMNPTPMSKLASHLVEVSELQKQARKNTKFRTALLFMRSIADRLEGAVDSIYNTLQERLATKAEQLSACRHFGTVCDVPQEHPSSFYKHTSRLFDRTDTCEIQINAAWSADCHVLEKIYLESSGNPVIHLLDIIRLTLSTILDPIAPTWRILGRSVCRRMGCLRWSDSLSSPDLYIPAGRPSILVVPHVTGNENIPDDVDGILFLGQPGAYLPITPCLLSPLALRARQRNVLLAGCLSPEIFSALYFTRSRWDGMLAEVIVDVSRSNIRLRLDPLNPNSNAGHPPTCYPDTETDHWTLLSPQSWQDATPPSPHSWREAINSSTLAATSFDPLTRSDDTIAVPDTTLLPPAIRGLRTLDSLVTLGLVYPPRLPISLSLPPPLYAYLIEGGGCARQLQDTLNPDGSAWLIDVHDFWVEGFGSEAMAFKSLNARFELSDELAPTIGVPFSGLDHALSARDNLQRASRLAHHCLELETLGSARFCEAKGRANELLKKCRGDVLSLVPPLDFLLEFQENQKIAAICRGSKKSSVLRRFGDSGALELWRALLMVWSGIFNLPVHLAAVAHGIVPSSIRAAVIIQDVRAVDYTFTLHCNIPLRPLRQNASLRPKLAFQIANQPTEVLDFPSFRPPSTVGSPLSSSFGVDTGYGGVGLDEYLHGSPLENRCSTFMTNQQLADRVWLPVPPATQDFAERGFPHMLKASGVIMANHLEEKRFQSISQYWDSLCRIPLNVLSAYRCPFGRNMPTTVTYGEVTSGLRLRRSEILPHGRTLPSSPYAFVACQTCLSCTSQGPTDECGRSYWPSEPSENVVGEKRLRAMTTSDLSFFSDSLPMTQPRGKLPHFSQSSSRPLQFGSSSQPPFEVPCNSPISSAGVASTTTARGRSFSLRHRRGVVPSHADHPTTTARRSSHIEARASCHHPLPFTPPKTQHKVFNSDRRLGRQTLALPDRTSSVKFRKSGLLFRACLNLDSLLLNDQLSGGSLIVATSHLRYGVHPSSSSSSSSSGGNSGIEPLIVNATWREHLVDRLMLLQEVLLRDSSQPVSLQPSAAQQHQPPYEGPWIIEGVFANGGLSVTGCRPVVASQWNGYDPKDYKLEEFTPHQQSERSLTFCDTDGHGTTNELSSFSTIRR